MGGGDPSIKNTHKVSMATNWKDYQEEAASFFRALGLIAETDVTLKGVRTKHDVDVVVRSQHAGFQITWIVECKHWKKRITKLHVLGLRQIVSDIGADRGIILGESGFQIGALEAANLTNIQLTSLAELALSSRNAIYSMRLRDLHNRVEECNERYWKIPKGVRMDVGLRPESQGYGYSATRTINLVRDLLSRSYRGRYPFSSDTLEAFFDPSFPAQFQSQQEVFEFAEPLVTELEQLLAVGEVKAKSRLTEQPPPPPF
jgi:hypothetical protein